MYWFGYYIASITSYKFKLRKPNWPYQILKCTIPKNDLSLPDSLLYWKIHRHETNFAL